MLKYWVNVLSCQGMGLKFISYKSCAPQKWEVTHMVDDNIIIDRSSSLEAVLGHYRHPRLGEPLPYHLTFGVSNPRFRGWLEPLLNIAADPNFRPRATWSAIAHSDYGSEILLMVAFRDPVDMVMFKMLWE